MSAGAGAGQEAARAALEAADAALRRSDRPSARHHLERSAAFRALGFVSAADADLDCALVLGSADPAVLAAVVDAHSGDAARLAAAAASVADDRASESLVRRAAELLLDRGHDPLLRVRRDGPWVTGWVASRDPIPSRIWSRAADGTRLPVMSEDEAGVGGAPGASLTPWRVRDHAIHGAIETIHAVSGTGAAASVPAPARRGTSPLRRPSGGAVHGTRPARPTIIVPAYGDPISLAACLASIERQGWGGLATIVIDDASPDPEVSRSALAFCRGPRRLYLRNPANRGFAASVNAALVRAARTDVLLLNSDVVLPEGALRRLACAAYSAPDIGIASPLSNDNGNASFPDPLLPCPAPLPEEALRLDRAAAEVNRGVVVDLPSVHGSCLYVRRDCLDRTGPLSEAYGRGYFEDVDLCIRAREAGYRVVAACDVYVAHLGGRSFGRARLPLIARNVGVLDARFPGHGAEDAAHDRADPLRPARAAIEGAAPPRGDPVVLVVGRGATRSALLRRRARSARREGAASAVLSWSDWPDAPGWTIAGEAGSEPRSLTFPRDAAGLERLIDYLGRLSVARIEVCEAHALPADLADALSGVEAGAVAMLLDGAPAVRAAAASQARLRTAVPARLEPVDAMARALADGTPGFGPGGGTGAGPASIGRTYRVPAIDSAGKAGHEDPSRIRLGVPLPQPCLAAERLLLELARRLHRLGSARVLVFGAPALAGALDGPGTLWASGPMDVDEMPDAFLHHGVDGLLLPYRDSHHWVLEAVRGDAPPAAYFDWSPAGLPHRGSDLPLDAEESDAACAARIIAWLGGAAIGAPA